MKASEITALVDRAFHVSRVLREAAKKAEALIPATTDGRIRQLEANHSIYGNLTPEQTPTHAMILAFGWQFTRVDQALNYQTDTKYNYKFGRAYLQVIADPVWSAKFEDFTAGNIISNRKSIVGFRELATFLNKTQQRLQVAAFLGAVDG
jgi:hypothetical protein